MKIAAGVAFAVLCVALGLVMMAMAVQSGRFDGAIQRGLSAKTGRPITFGRLRASLLSPTPTLAFDDLAIGSPPAISPVKLLIAPHAVMRIHALTALTGGASPFELELTRPVAHLVRLGHGRNNYTLGPGAGAGGWRKFVRLQVTDGQLQYDDPERHATLKAAFSYDPSLADPRPLRITGGGAINDGDFTVDAKGAALAGYNAAKPYPFEAVIQDGQLKASVTGFSGKPFDFRQFDLTFDASGPNLADFTYLFEAPAPNTAAFHLSAQVKRRQPQLWMTGIVAKAGDTDLTGSLFSDHPAGGRRMIQAQLNSNALHLRDLRIVMTPHQTHAQTRQQPGAPPPAGGGGMLSDKPFKAQEMRKTDLELHIQAARMPDAPFNLRDLDTVLTLKSGRLSLSPTTFSTGPGTVAADVVLDASRPVPAISVSGRLRAARLAALKPGLAKQADGKLELDVHLSGSGASPRAAAKTLHGRLALRLSDGRLQQAEAAALGADLIKAAGLRGKTDAQSGLHCAVADFDAAAGRLTARDLTVVTDAGWAEGQGGLDLGAQTVAVTLQGHAANPKPLQVDAPVHVEGPLAQPKVKVDAAKGLGRAVASLAGKPKVLAPDCATLLAKSAAFGAAR